MSGTAMLTLAYDTLDNAEWATEVGGVLVGLLEQQRADQRRFEAAAGRAIRTPLVRIVRLILIA